MRSTSKPDVESVEQIEWMIAVVGLIFSHTSYRVTDECTGVVACGGDRGPFRITHESRFSDHADRSGAVVSRGLSPTKVL